MHRTTRIGRVGLALVLLALAYGTFRFRHTFVGAFFVPGSGRAAAPDLALPSAPDLATRGLAPTERVRVVLVDGVALADARTMPSYSAVCASGLDLVLDVGFPTVSLPVQHALWTGLTQQQTGILFFYKLLDPPADGIPGKVPGSVAVAESHAKIVHSMGFARALPPLDDVPADWNLDAGWRSWLAPERAHGFERAALHEVAGDAPLAFVHILRTDSIAHKRGRHSTEYRTALGWADRLLGRLVAADRSAHGSGTRWFVLADHGHRDGGGHGGAEPWIRNTRLCIAGAGVDASPGARGSGYLHLVDLSRALADSLGVAPDPRSAGRPLYAALAASVQRTATLPRPGGARWAIAVVLLLGAVLGTAWAARGSWLTLPWWWPVAYLSVLVIELTPSLSTHMIYKPDGRIMYLAALPGLILLAVLVFLALRRRSAARVAVSQLLLPAALALGSLVLCGGARLLAGISGEPPLVPMWTGHASLFLVLWFSGATVVAAAVFASAILPSRRRER